MEYDIVASIDGNIYYYKKGTKIYHREDGPAIEFKCGDKYWYINGECHREDGPAIEYVSGTKFWYINGKLHREDGPAIKWADGLFSWYINGKKLSREKELILNKWWNNKNGI